MSRATYSKRSFEQKQIVLFFRDNRKKGPSSKKYFLRSQNVFWEVELLSFSSNIDDSTLILTFDHSPQNVLFFF